MSKNIHIGGHITKLLSRLYALGYMPRLGILLIDLFLCVVAFLFSYVLGLNLFQYGVYDAIAPLWKQGLLMIVIQCVFFLAFRTYTGILRYSTFIDTLKILLAIGCTTVTMFLFNLLITVNERYFLNTHVVLYFFIAFVMLFCLRVVIKLVFEQLQLSHKDNKRVLIYGTKEAGISIAKMLRSSHYAPYQVVGFLDDQDPQKSRKKGNHQILGLDVYYISDTLPMLLEKLQVQNIIISPLKIKEERARREIRKMVEKGYHVLTTPYFTDWQNPTSQEDEILRVGRINSIQIEDLLERPLININTDNVRQIIQGKVVMVTGAAGSIGSEIARQVIGFEANSVILFDQAESPLHELRLELQNHFPNQVIISIIGDVRNRERVEEIISEMHPNVIFHAAAYKHVPLMEDFPNEAIHANVEGTKNMADMAVKYGVERFVMISTDKAVNPTNIMGASKRIAEIYVQSLFKHLQAENENCTKFITTRFGNVLGSNGSVIPYFKKQIAEGGPVTVTHPDIIRYFMTIPEACTLVLEASTLGNGGEIFVFDMGKPVRIADLAKNMIRLAGFIPGEDIQIVYTGLRPGEKLYEELLNQKETTLPTINEKIMVAKVREFPFDKVKSLVDELIQISYQAQPFITVAQMKKIVPEYISKNSVYEQLDRKQKADTAK